MRDRKDYHKHYDQTKRDQRAKIFYNSDAWLAVREEALIRDIYLCQECLRRKKITPADMVHHIVPLRDDWDKGLDLDNLESLCSACHNREHPEKGTAKKQERKRKACVVKVKANKEVW